MAAVATYLADTSCLNRVHREDVARVLSPRLTAGLVAVCAMTEFEMLWSTRSPQEFDQLEADLCLMEQFWIEAEDWRRAREVQRELWHRGQMRAVGLPDLLVAAVAERHRVTVLHYDRDFDVIATVTGQPTTWVVEPGSVP